MKRLLLSINSFFSRVLIGMVTLMPTDNLYQFGVKKLSAFIRLLPLPQAMKMAYVSNSLKLDKSKFDFVFDTKIEGIKWRSSGFPDILTRHTLFEGLYQDDVLLVIENMVKEGDIFFDVGGHHGLMALASSKSVGESGMVYAFEPNPAVLPILRENVVMNKFQNIHIADIALSDKPGKIPFYQQTGDISWNSTIIEEFLPANAKEIEVEADTLDNYVNQHSLIPSFIKIDTEGAELLILEGAKETLRKFLPVLIMEFNASAAEAANTTIEAIVSFLQGLSYQIFRLNKNKLGYYDDIGKMELIEGSVAFENVVCIPKSKMDLLGR